MPAIFSENNELLQTQWIQKSQKTTAEPLSLIKFIEFIKEVLVQTNVLPNFDPKTTDLPAMIQEYLKEVQGEENYQGIDNIQFSFEDGIDFLKWMTNTIDEDKQYDHQEEQLEQQEKGEQEYKQEGEYIRPGQKELEQGEQLQRSGGKNEIDNKLEHQERLLTNQSEVSQTGVNMQLSNSNKSQIKNNSREDQFIRKPIQDQPNASVNRKKIKTINSEQEQDLEYEAHRNNYHDEKGAKTSLHSHQFNLAVKYKDFLKIVFDHYCRISYATGQDPTFQQIMHKTTVMTINKFMIFCKDFEIQKTSNLLNRAYLLELFKKNSLCYKEMTLDLFIAVIQKIAVIVNSENAEQSGELINPKQQSPDPLKEQFPDLLKQQITQPLRKFLQQLQISTYKQFKDKMKKLNIQYRLGTVTKIANEEIKKIPIDYKFKFTSNNGKSQEQIKQEIYERKINRSEKKMLLRQKTNNQDSQEKHFRIKKTHSLSKKIGIQNKLASRSRDSNGQQLSLQRQDQIAQSVQTIKKKILIPPLHPAKKISERSNAPSTSNKAYTNDIIQEGIFKKEKQYKPGMGYADMHKLKLVEGYSRKHINSNRNDRDNYKLNSIVEEARMQVALDQEEPYNSDNTSFATNSREQQERIKAYDINKINHKMQIINSQILKEKESQAELGHLLDMDIDEDDEFLKEHLHREKKNELIGKRLSTRIDQLQQSK